MEFRLTYLGWLPPASQNDLRKAEKHAIRRVFSQQLRELWKTHPRLSGAMVEGTTKASAPGRTTGASIMAWEHWNRCGRNFLPLITKDAGVACGLDILFLRRDQPGALIRSGGDIDNRIKVLFDALRMPQNCDEVAGPPEGDDDPFFCLLEDDSLITEVRVTTDRLLSPRQGTEHLNDVHLIIHVKSIVMDTGDLAALAF